MIRRLGMAVVVAGVALGGLATGTAAAAPADPTGCADFHWMGAAGSGQRDGAKLTQNGGMGDVVYQSYEQLDSELAASGYTMTAEAVQYPAAPVPLDGVTRVRIDVCVVRSGPSGLVVEHFPAAITAADER